MFVTCGICCNYCTVNMVTSQTKSVWGFKDVDVYDPVSEKPPLKNIYYPSEAHCGGFQVLTSCSRTANEVHLCCITILFNSTRSGTMWRKWYTSASSLLHFTQRHRRWLLFQCTSIPWARSKSSREDFTRRRGGGKVGADDLWSGRHCQGATDYKKRGEMRKNQATVSPDHYLQTNAFLRWMK